ncbi:MAG TPA: hypothetical protein VMZ91_06325 [Candidatus Paceibacterota bacterium]|nr:hypothetical protein [Candidatus Paceibacterota bacterium]
MKKSLIESIDDFITPMLFKTDEDLFGRMINFIMELEPDSLTTEQLNIVMSIIEDIESQDDMEESILKSKKSTMSHNRYSKKYYSLNKTKVNNKKDQVKKSLDGKEKERKEEIMKKSNRTPTGKKKTRYNTKDHTN